MFPSSFIQLMYLVSQPAFPHQRSNVKVTVVAALTFYISELFKSPWLSDSEASRTA